MPLLIEASYKDVYGVFTRSSKRPANFQ